MGSVYGYRVCEDGTVYGKHGKKLSPSDNGRGYLVLGLMIEGRGRVTFGVHRLVALAYLENPEGLPEVNHKDGNKLNNHFSNLEWCTRGGNILHAYESKLRSAVGVKNARCQTDEEEVRAICGALECGYTSAQIRDQGYDYNLVRAIKSRKNWSHISNSYNF